jgi:NADH-quinone oxidoreductase subunit H
VRRFYLSEISSFGRDIILQATDIDVAFVPYCAMSIGVYGIMIGGWASNNKFSLSCRAASQMISYEVGMGLSLIAL